FGIAFEEIEGVYARASKLKHLRLRGLQMHIGSQITEVNPFEQAVRKVLPLVTRLKEKHGLEFFSLGGGLGIVYKPALASGSAGWWKSAEGRQVITPKKYAARLVPLLKPLGLRILMEPGRFISGNAGILVTRVEYVKRTGKKNFLIVDAAMNDLIRPAFYEAYHEILPATRKAGALVSSDVVGPICESGDFFCQDNRARTAAGAGGLARRKDRAVAAVSRIRHKWNLIMDNLDKEIAELKQFIIDLKADRAETKEKEKREAWTKYVSLTVVIIAVVAAVAAQWSGKYGSSNQMSQAQASDQWAFYQAKSIKQHLDEVTLAQLTRNGNTNDPELAKTIKKLSDNLGRYEKEKAEIKGKAEALEKLRDEASRRGGRMSLAISYFTVAIATASICTVTKKKPLWFVALILSAAAAMQMVLAWT
ncbi:MAG: DUF4337 family protein, partial [Verrucomicrobia bacterium]|nr:DUF4337 family protein [Verrucomicrobiota bacterium]